MEKCLKNRIAIEVFDEICAEDSHGTAPESHEDPPEQNEHPHEKRVRRSGEDISPEKVKVMTDMARVHLEDVSRQVLDKYLRHYQEKATDPSVAPNDSALLCARSFLINRNFYL